MYLTNEIKIDGKIQKDVKVFDAVANFNISSVTGKYLTVENETKNRYTYIRVVYTGPINDDIKRVLQPGKFVRLVGKLDSEQYQSKTGKTVYNKIICADKVKELVYDPEFGILTEVS